MNFGPVNFGGVTDREKATHMSPPCICAGVLNHPGMVSKSTIDFVTVYLGQAYHAGNAVEDAPVLKTTRIKVHSLFVCVFLAEIIKGMREVTQTALFILNGLMEYSSKTFRTHRQSTPQEQMQFQLFGVLNQY